MRQYEKWIIKASHDLMSAQKLLSGDDKILDTAIYHAQQCAEKALKAFLAYKSQEIERTHDLELLIEICSDLDNDFERFIDDAELLTPYCTIFRYPDIVLEPEIEEVIEAIEKAKNILQFVEKKIKI